MDPGLESDPDRPLVRRFVEQGDEVAFRLLYRRHAGVLYAVILRLLGGREPEAQDVLQETWLRACHSLPSFRWGSKLRTWLTGIAINCVRERGKRKVEDALPDLPREPADQTQPAEPMGFARLDWEKAIAQLPQGYRQVVVLFDVQGYTHEEVGRLLGISPGTSKSQLSHARSALRVLLGAPREA